MAIVLTRRQLSNTITNLAYVVVGTSVAIMYPTYLGIMFAVCMTLVAIGSSIWHYTEQKPWANALDRYAIFILMSFMIGAAASNIPWEVNLVWTGSILIAFSLYMVSLRSFLVIGIMAFILTAALFIKGPWYVGLAALLLALGSLFTNIKSHTSQYHGVGWHLGTAGALGLIMIVLLGA